MSENRSKLRESMREMVVVVASILIAFGLDAMWDDIQERKREARMLTALAGDMRFNVQELDENVARHHVVLDATEALLRLMDEPSASIDLMSFDTLVRRSTTYWTYDPRVGSIESVLRDLDLVRATELRAAIAAWPETLRDFREDEERGAAAVDERILPTLQRMVPIRVHTMDFGFGRVVESPEAARARLTPQAVRAVLSDLFLANEFTGRAGRQIIIISEAADLRDLMVRIVDLIEQDLGT